MKKMQNDHDVAPFASELQWLAFCYVAGELTTQQTFEFEQRIADDLEAQLAVADAVALSVATCASLETLTENKVSLDGGRVADAARGSAWRWGTVAVAGLVAIVLAWQLLPGSVPNDDVAVQSLNQNGQVTNSISGKSTADLWGRMGEMHQSANLHGDGFEIWSAEQSPAGDDVGQEYESADDGSEEIADVLLVDSDLASIFASALWSVDPSKGEM
jgi:anti-sigma-K factor RskA